MRIGSLIGSIVVSFRSKSGPNRLILVMLPIIISILFIFIGFTDQFAISAIFIGITGFFLVFFSTTANSTTQFNSKNEFRGRVMSIYTLFFAGTTPIGNFFCGLVMKYFGARYGFICCGLVIALFIAFFYIFKNSFIKNFLKCDPLAADKPA
jgi:predicted MFS family arabinose efflux permease